MRYVVVVALIVCGAALAARPGGHRIVPSECSRSLPLLKVLADRQRFQVNTRGKSVDIPFIYRQRPPAVQPQRRTTSWQRAVWEVKGQIVEYKLDHAAIRMVIYWDGKYFNAILPSPFCLKAKSRLKGSMVGTWNNFLQHCGIPVLVYQSLGAVVYVRGTGFWSNKNLPRRGGAPNGAEIQPVTRIDIVAGCGT